MISFDLKSGYHHTCIEINPDHYRFLGDLHGNFRVNFTCTILYLLFFLLDCPLLLIFLF